MLQPPIARAKIAHFTDKGYAVQGVVHVGANDGEEIPYYVSMGHTPIIAFEPGREAFSQLATAFEGVAECHNLALGRTNTTGWLRLPEDGSTKGASLLVEPGQSEFAERILVWRFDTWAAVRDLSAYNALVVDVQGMELDVLEGFGDRLDGFHYLNIECSEVPVYVGEASAREVIDFLAERGFRQDSPIEPHNDIMFVRE
jgi:FkbM family methyltransferase